MLRLWLILWAFMALVGCEQVVNYFGLQPDSFPEEMTEEALFFKFGTRVDLTPSTPEKK